MEKCAEMVVRWLVKRDEIKVDDRDLYKYAVESLILMFLPIIFAGSIGFFTGNIVQAVVLVLPVMILRKFSGGYHASKLKTCIISSGCLLFLCILLAQRLRYDWKLVVLTILSATSLSILSPVDHENKRLGNEEKRVLKKITVLCVTSLLILGMIVAGFEYYCFAVSLFIGIQLTAALQILCIIKKVIEYPKITGKCRLTQNQLKS